MEDSTNAGGIKPVANFSVYVEDTLVGTASVITSEQKSICARQAGDYCATSKTNVLLTMTSPPSGRGKRIR